MKNFENKSLVPIRDPEDYDVGVITWPQLGMGNPLNHWALAITTAEPDVLHLLHIIGNHDDGYKLQFRRSWDLTTTKVAATWHFIGNVGAEYVYDTNAADSLDLDEISDQPFDHDAYEMTAVEIFVPGPMPAEVRSSEELFPNKRAYLKYFLSDHENWPRCDRWVKTLIERLVVEEKLVIAEGVNIEDIPRYCMPVEEYLTKFYGPE